MGRRDDERLVTPEHVVLLLLGVGVVFAVSGGRWLSIPVGLVCVGVPLLLHALVRRRRGGGVPSRTPGN